MYNYTNYNCSHWNSNEKLKDKCVSYTRKAKHSIDSLQKTALLGTSSRIIQKVPQCEMKPERWGSPLVQEKYQEESL
jgi:hypothetical protein